MDLKILEILILFIFLSQKASAEKLTDPDMDILDLENEIIERNRNYICQENDEDRKRRETQCNCPSIYAPVCGSDGVTYHNRCFINCVAESRQEYARYEKLTIVKMSECNAGHH